jgi:curved DNA-binding protein CbpA
MTSALAWTREAWGRGAGDEPTEPDDDDEPADELEPLEPAVDPEEPLPLGAPDDEGADGTGTDGVEGAWTDGVEGTLGALGTDGVAGAAGRLGTVGVGTGGAGTVGVGRPSANAAPAPPETASASVVPTTKARLTLVQLRRGRIGCGLIYVSLTVAQTPTQRRDYYDVLGIAQDADDEEIKHAFHALAREVHPDVSASPEADQRFSELAEAYAVLSKPEKRLLYDRFGVRGQSAGFSERLLDAALGEPESGNDLVTEVELGYYEAARGTTRTVKFVGAAPCGRCGGLGRRGKTEACETCDGTGRRKMLSEIETGRLLQVEQCPDCGGSGRGGGRTCASCAGEGRAEVRRTIRVRIPAGVEDGQTVRIRGEGIADPEGGPAGDAFVVVRVLDPPRDPRLVRMLAVLGIVVAIALILKLALG